MNASYNYVKKKKNRFVFVVISLILFIAPFIMIEVNVYKNLDQIKFIIDLRKKLGDKLTKIIVIISAIFWRRYMQFFLIVLVFSYSNIHKAFILLNTIAIQYFITGIIKNIYKKNFPFSKNIESLKPYFCELGYGLPSTSISIVVPFYLSLARMIFDNQYNKLCLKIIMLIVNIIIIIISIFGEILNGYYYLDQIIFGFLIGLSLYIFLFYVLKINLNEGKTFYNIIKYKIYVYFIIYALLIVALLIPFIINHKNKKKDFGALCNPKYDFKIKGNYDSYDYSNDSTFFSACYIMASFCFIVAAKLELRFILKDRVESWKQYNFFDFEYENGNEKMISSSDVKITKNMKWNNTNKRCTNLLRFIVVLFFSVICFIPFYLIYYENNKFYLDLFVKQLLPLCLFYFGIGFLFKFILMKTKLVNDELFSIVNEMSMISMI